MHKDRPRRSSDKSPRPLADERETARAPAPALRSRLPGLEALRFFEAASRHASFTKAAKELCVTQAAVSHRIQALEAELCVSLFRRLTRRIELTPEGERLAEGVRGGLAQIARAVGDLDRDAEIGPLQVSMLPSFASRWLIPRLPRFQSAHPDIAVRVMAEDHSIDLWADDRADLAIRFGRGRYPSLATTPLMSDSIIPVCSPALLARHGRVTTVDALLDLPLLHDSAAERDDSGTDWKSWLGYVGEASDDPRLAGGPRFSHAHFAIEAALLGQGVALARTSLAGGDLSSGRLVSPLPQAAPTMFRYYLVCRPDMAQRHKIVCFRNWLIAETHGVAGEPRWSNRIKSVP
jgi:LysR family glycine cleavage system transcriptional activator